jgi:Rrf2 family protein
MLSRTGLYALQALLHLAVQGNGTQVSASAMADALEIPRTYLAKVLQRLAREGVLESTRGAGGGYRLVADPARLTVAGAVAPFEELRAPQTCLMGGACDLTNPCAAHARRTAWNQAAMEILEQTTLADLLSGAPLESRGSVHTTRTEALR